MFKNEDEIGLSQKLIRFVLRDRNEDRRELTINYSTITSMKDEQFTHTI